jgi:hypothetical protein
MAKTNPFKATPVPSLAGKDWSDKITRAEVVALLAKGVPQKTTMRKTCAGDRRPGSTMP